MEYDAKLDKFIIESESASGEKQKYISQNLAIGIGTKPRIPKWLETCKHPLVKHSAEFAKIQEQLKQCKQVTVIGSVRVQQNVCLLYLIHLPQNK